MSQFAEIVQCGEPNSLRELGFLVLSSAVTQRLATLDVSGTESSLRSGESWELRLGKPARGANSTRQYLVSFV